MPRLLPYHVEYTSPKLRYTADVGSLATRCCCNLLMPRLLPFHVEYTSPKLTYQICQIYTNIRNLVLQRYTADVGSLATRCCCNLLMPRLLPYHVEYTSPKLRYTADVGSLATRCCCNLLMPRLLPFHVEYTSPKLTYQICQIYTNIRNLVLQRYTADVGSLATRCCCNLLMPRLLPYHVEYTSPKLRYTADVGSLATRCCCNLLMPRLLPFHVEYTSPKLRYTADVGSLATRCCCNLLMPRLLPFHVEYTSPKLIRQLSCLIFYLRTSSAVFVRCCYGFYVTGGTVNLR
ncbi:uncharacterized protein LOC120636135 isoform X4 [Pararge aegeria]|uniref:uncharacterized protein LOC120636135 isoform X4 n=1 Tax=Pararge aegeria TaxID=116150 RepID=UPI0019CF9150|nr:uncharacterized protein LOC120636135 isoform X4 [Pararge aegeria]